MGKENRLPFGLDPRTNERIGIGDYVRELAAPELQKTKRVPIFDDDYGQPDLKALTDELLKSYQHETRLVILNGPPGVGKTNRKNFLAQYFQIDEPLAVCEWEAAEQAAIAKGDVVIKDQTAPWEKQDLMVAERKHAAPQLAQAMMNYRNVVTEYPATDLRINGKWQTGRSLGSKLLEDIIMHRDLYRHLFFRRVIGVLEPGVDLELYTDSWRTHMKNSKKLQEGREVAAAHGKTQPQTEEEWLAMKQNGAWPAQIAKIRQEDQKVINELLRQGYIEQPSRDRVHAVFEEHIEPTIAPWGVDKDKALARLNFTLLRALAMRYKFRDTYRIPADSPHVGIFLNNPSMEDFHIANSQDLDRLAAYMREVA